MKTCPPLHWVLIRLRACCLATAQSVDNADPDKIWNILNTDANNELSYQHARAWRHGGEFTNFGDYSVKLFKKFRGHPNERPLFDMASVAILKNAKWADRVTRPAPRFRNGKWINRPNNPRKIVIWENFDKEAIMKDIYERMSKYVLVKSS